MNNSTPQLPTTRREFLRLSSQGIGLLAFSHFAPSFLVQSALAGAPTPEKDRTVLVLVQLAGGNDGLNTVVPYEDDRYYGLRPSLGIRKQDVLHVGGGQGFHPALGPLHALLQEGKLAVVQNVGYPNPNRSHFRSTEIWETGSSSNEFLSSGWLGRFFDNACGGVPEDQAPAGIHVSNEVPQSFMAAEPHPTFGLSADNRGGRQRTRDLALLETFARPADEEHVHETGSFLRHTLMDALVTEKKVKAILSGYRPAASYPNSPFAQSLRQVAGLIASGLPTRVYFVTLGGFDTHRGQTATHANLLRTLAGGMAAFQQDLESHRLADQVLTMTFSEFGRRPAENESGGTDHGTAAPLFVMGSRVQGGFWGTAPDLNIQRDQDLRYSTDFRQVYSTVLDQWLHCPAQDILGERFPPVAFL